MLLEIEYNAVLMASDGRMRCKASLLVDVVMLQLFVVVFLMEHTLGIA